MKTSVHFLLPTHFTLADLHFEEGEAVVVPQVGDCVIVESDPECEPISGIVKVTERIYTYVEDELLIELACELVAKR